jgi:membrane protein implicated in regulation of membrane protease activity
MQSRQQSIIEVICSTLAAFLLSVLAGAYIYPLFDFYPSGMQNATITFIFTIISLVRSYLFRRFFNWLHSK